MTTLRKNQEAAFAAVQSLIEKSNDKTKPLISISVAKDAVGSALEKITTYSDSLKGLKSTPGLKRDLKVITNTLTGLATSIEKRRIKYSGMVHVVREDVQDRLDTLELLSANIPDSILDTKIQTEEERASSLAATIGDAVEEQIEQSAMDKASIAWDEEDAKAVKAKQKVNDHSKKLVAKLANFQKRYAAKLPRKLQNPSGFQIVEVPIVANFKTKMQFSRLEKLGLPIEPYSLTGHGSDIGYIFTKQPLLIFDRKAAKALAEEEAQEHLDNSSSERAKIQISNLKKQVSKKKKELKQYEPAKGKKLTAKTAKQYAPKISKIDKKIAELDARIEGLKKHTQPSAVTKRIEKGLKNTSDIYAKTALNAVEAISEMSATAYTLVSTNGIDNPRNAGLTMFWLMPTNLYRKLDSLMGGNVQITSWNLAWGRAANVYNKKVNLESLDYPTSLQTQR